MLGVINSPATVKRYLNDLRAIFNYGLFLFELTKSVSNPFDKLPVKMPAGGAKDDRHPFSPSSWSEPGRVSWDRPTKTYSASGGCWRGRAVASARSRG